MEKENFIKNFSNKNISMRKPQWSEKGSSNDVEEGRCHMLIYL
jgi:hypothetical protein